MELSAFIPKSRIHGKINRGKEIGGYTGQFTLSLNMCPSGVGNRHPRILVVTCLWEGFGRPSRLFAIAIILNA
jgi:hypothetical protein